MLAKCLVHVRQQSVAVAVAVTLGSGVELHPEAPSLRLVLSGQIRRPSLNYRFVSSGYLLAVWDFADLGALIVFSFWGDLSTATFTRLSLLLPAQSLLSACCWSCTARQPAAQHIGV